MCINHDVVSDTMLYLARLYTSNNTTIICGCTLCMHQQFISDVMSTRSIINKTACSYMYTT